MRGPLLRLRPRRPPSRFDALLQHNRVTLLHDGAECFSAMLEAIAGAQHEVLFEMYWLGSDRTGTRFVDALCERARAGLTVCVIYDAVGSIDADEAIFVRMREAGCDVRQYNPIAPWRQRFNIGLVNNRDHRKIIVADQAIAFTGGINAADQWAPESGGGEGWRDDMIRIEGLAALQMRDVFLHTWRELGGRDPAPTMSEQQLRDSGARVPERGSPVRVLANHYNYERAAIRRSYLEAIRSARHHIYITNSYFVPDREVRVALARAAAREVDVKVIVPGDSDVPAVYWAARNLYAWLMRHGVELYEWHGSVLHAKTAAVDDRWCTVGTFNMDYRSWRSNLEVNVAVEDASVARAMGRRFRHDLERCERVDPHDFRFRPLSERLFESFFYLFRRLL